MEGLDRWMDRKTDRWTVGWMDGWEWNATFALIDPPGIYRIRFGGSAEGEGLNGWVMSQGMFGKSDPKIPTPHPGLPIYWQLGGGLAKLVKWYFFMVLHIRNGSESGQGWVGLNKSPTQK